MPAYNKSAYCINSVYQTNLLTIIVGWFFIYTCIAIIQFSIKFYQNIRANALWIVCLSFQMQKFNAFAEPTIHQWSNELFARRKFLEVLILFWSTKAKEIMDVFLLVSPLWFIYMVFTWSGMVWVEHMYVHISISEFFYLYLNFKRYWFIILV